jgi:hypothetical protein
MIKANSPSRVSSCDVVNSTLISRGRANQPNSSSAQSARLKMITINRSRRGRSTST